MAWSGVKRLLSVLNYAGRDGTFSPISPEEYQRELVVLGLSGKEFAPASYAAALGTYLGTGISIHVLAETHRPHVARMLARSGTMAQLSYSADPPTAVILVPSGLPPTVRTLSIYHELAHVAVGDPLAVWEDGTKTGRHVWPDRRLAKRPALHDEGLREREADLRAAYSVVAGSLGPDSPYAQGVYDAL
jgi:hypothetical protein